MARCTGAVLAAGAGSRMGGPKAGLQVGGQRLVDRAVAALLGAGCAPVFAVVRGAMAVPDAYVVVNPEPERGMRSSLQLAVDAAGADQPLAVVLADMPEVDAEVVRAVVGAWSPGRIATATYRGVQAPPTVAATSQWREALAAAGPDAGARGYLLANPQVVDAVRIDRALVDLDEPADMSRWAPGSAGT